MWPGGREGVIEAESALPWGLPLGGSLGLRDSWGVREVCGSCLSGMGGFNVWTESCAKRALCHHWGSGVLWTVKELGEKEG